MLRQSLRFLPASIATAAAFGSAVAYSSLPVAPWASTAEAEVAAALSPSEWKGLKLIKKEQLTHNTFRLRFELPGGQAANLPVASCLLTKIVQQEPGKEKPSVIIRPYTPVSAPDAKGYLDLVVKAYPQGQMSKHMGDMSVGQQLDFKGPIMKYPYKPNEKGHVGMIAGGTGITPMLQVADHILSNPQDKTQVSLIFANVSEEDIILRDHIDKLARQHPKQFQVFYVVDKVKPGAKWQGGVGYITPGMIKQHMPAPSPSSMVMVCGPPPMMNAISGDKAPDKSQGPLTGVLKQLGYDESNVYKF